MNLSQRDKPHGEDAKNDEGDALEHEEPPARAQRGLHPTVKVVQIGIDGGHEIPLSSSSAPLYPSLAADSSDPLGSSGVLCQFCPFVRRIGAGRIAADQAALLSLRLSERGATSPEYGERGPRRGAALTAEVNVEAIASIGRRRSPSSSLRPRSRRERGEEMRNHRPSRPSASISAALKR